MLFFGHAVEPLYNRHFRTTLFGCNTEIFLFKRYQCIEAGLLGPKLFILSSEVSLIQKVLQEKFHCNTHRPVFLHSFEISGSGSMYIRLHALILHQDSIFYKGITREYLHMLHLRTDLRIADMVCKPCMDHVKVLISARSLKKTVQEIF